MSNGSCLKLPPLSISLSELCPLKRSPPKMPPLSQDQEARDQYNTPQQSPKTNLTCPPCKRIRLKAIPDFLLPPPFFNLELTNFTTSFRDE